MVENTSDATFEADVIKADTPVIVDFYADWCGPCKMMGPVFEKIAKEYEGKVKFVKCNVEENQDMPSKYGVRGIPNLIIFKDGKAVKQEAGYQTEAQLKALVDGAI